MSVETLLAATEASAASPAVPAPPPSAATPEEVTPAAVPPTEETPKVQPTEGEAPETAEEVEPNLDETPESSGDFPKYKHLFKDNPELRQIIGREKAVSELGPTFSELREIVQRIPSVADAEQLVADSENKRLLGQTFREDPSAFVESLRDSDPLAFQNLTKQLPDILAETNPELYSEQARAYSHNVLNNLFTIAQRDGNQALFDAVQLVASSLGERLGTRQQPAERSNSELSRLRKQLEERQQADSDTAFNNFWSQTDQTVITQSVSEISTAIKKALPSASEAQMQRMVKEAYDQTLALLEQQPQTVSQVNAYRENARKGKQGIAEHKAIVSYITGRTKLVIPKAVKSVIDEWSKQVLKLNNDKTDKQKSIAANSKDVGTGPQGTSSAATGTPAKPGPQRHVKDILSEIAAGTYVKH